MLFHKTVAQASVPLHEKRCDMVHVTERAKEMRLERKRSANINDPAAGPTTGLR